MLFSVSFLEHALTYPLIPQAIIIPNILNYSQEGKNYGLFFHSFIYLFRIASGRTYKRLKIKSIQNVKDVNLMMNNYSWTTIKFAKIELAEEYLRRLKEWITDWFFCVWQKAKHIHIIDNKKWHFPLIFGFLYFWLHQ